MASKEKFVKMSEDSNAFLRNDYECRVYYNGIIYRNAEAAYQAQKTMDIDERETFGELSASEALLKGRQVNLRSDWEEVRDIVMIEVLAEKFVNPELKDKLVALGSDVITNDVEGDNSYWGTGDDRLGELLTFVKNSLIAEVDPVRLFNLSLEWEDVDDFDELLEILSEEDYELEDDYDIDDVSGGMDDYFWDD